MNTASWTRRHAYVDESKAKDYLLVSVAVSSSSLHDARGVVRLVRLSVSACIDEICSELDETRQRQDRQRIIEALHDVRPRSVDHRHERAANEPLLALPDAVGWAWAKGGDRRRRAGTVSLEDV